MIKANDTTTSRRALLMGLAAAGVAAAPAVALPLSEALPAPSAGGPAAWAWRASCPND
jgi:hypothetical protein